MMRPLWTRSLTWFGLVRATSEAASCVWRDLGGCKKIFNLSRVHVFARLSQSCAGACQH